MSELDDHIGEQIERLVKNNEMFEITASNLEPPGYYFVRNPGGKAELVKAKPSLHCEKIESPVEMDKFIAQRMGAKALLNPAIFYDEDAVVLAYDIDDRRDFAICNLQRSSQWNKLQQVANKAMPQKDFIRLLRVDFRGCLADTSLLNLLRGVQWTANDSGQTNIQHGKESLGRQITSQVQGVDVIPEELALTIPVFENHSFRVRVQCAIDVIVDSRSFGITPFPQEMHNALESALDDILLQFSKEGYPPAFRGEVFDGSRKIPPQHPPKDEDD